MATQPSPESDPDRTEELPQLDVAAYEASMLEAGTSSTDTWSVQALRDAVAEEEEEARAPVSPLRAKPQRIAADRSPDLTLDAERILTRVAQLEAELTSARVSNGELEQRIAASLAELTSLNDTNARLQEQLRKAADLSQTRDAEIEELEDRLDEQERHAAQMARYLAAKLVEHDALSLTVEQREQRMKALQSTCDDLTQQLQRAGAQLSDALPRAQAAERELAAAREQQRERDQELKARDGEIARIRMEADAVVARARALEADLQSAESKRAEQRGQIDQFELQLADGQRHVGVLVAELAHAREQVADLERSSADLIETKAALGAKRDELAHADEHIAALRSEVEGLSVQVAVQLQQLEAATAELAEAREHASQAAPAIEELEIALRARDELIAQLRSELQASQDERGTAAGQLQKARSRNKTLAHEVFQRDKRIATLQEDLAVHAETLAAIRHDIGRVGTSEPSMEAAEPQRILEPVGHDGPSISLNGKVVTVGRTSDNDACVPSKLVSRHHARLLVGPNAVIVEDAGSTNGCYVNDRLVKKQLMRDGDVLSLGDLRYRLRTVASQATRMRDNVVSMADREEDE